MPVEIEWLSMYDTEPTTDCDVNAKMPSAMKPKCAMETYARNRFMSRWPVASSDP